MKIRYTIACILFLSSTLCFAEDTKKESLVLAGGCFWCMEPPFDKIEGVLSTISGYSGGTKDNPKYSEVSSGTSGHYEVLKVDFDPKKVSAQDILKVFWKNIDPLDGKGQFCDKGPQYRSAIFYSNQNQKKIAEQSKAEIQIKLAKKGQVQTAILPFSKFFAAEDYHQDFYKKNPLRYKLYRTGCGRDKRLAELWSE